MVTGEEHQANQDLRRSLEETRDTLNWIVDGDVPDELRTHMSSLLTISDYVDGVVDVLQKGDTRSILGNGARRRARQAYESLDLGAIEELDDVVTEISRSEGPLKPETLGKLSRAYTMLSESYTPK